MRQVWNSRHGRGAKELQPLLDADHLPSSPLLWDGEFVQKGMLLAQKRKRGESKQKKARTVTKRPTVVCGDKWSDGTQECNGRTNTHTQNRADG